MPADRSALLAHDGVVVARDLLDDEWVSRLRDAVSRCRATPGAHYGVLSPRGSARVDSDLFRWFDNDDIAALTTSSPLVELAAELLGSDAVVLVEDQWFCSEPGATTPSPWHQDHPYYHLDRPFLTVWITLDDIPPDASLRVVPGSHLSGVLYAPVEFAAEGATIGPRQALEPVPDVDASPDRFPIRSWSLGAGDAVAFDSRLLHATGPAPIVGRPFRRISTRWATPSTCYQDRGEHGAKFWRMLPHGLSTGDRIAGEIFPLRRAGR